MAALEESLAAIKGEELSGGAKKTSESKSGLEVEGEVLRLEEVLLVEVLDSKAKSKSRAKAAK